MKKIKITKIKSKLKCPMCDITVIGFKFPPKEEGLYYYGVYNDKTSKTKYELNNNIPYKQCICLTCEEKLVTDYLNNYKGDDLENSPKGFL